MPKDKHRIGELPGISPAAVVGLNRIGIVTVHDLLHAEFDRVAYIVDDYNEASRLIKEAKKIPGADGSVKSRPRNGAPEPQVPSPLAPNSMAQAGRNQTRIASPQAPAAPQPRNQAPTPGPVVGHIGPQTGSGGHGVLASVLALSASGATLGGEQAEEGRALLCRRLSLATLMLEQGCSESEFLAGMLLEAAEAGTVQPEEVGSRFGPDVEKLLDECTALRAVPMLPTGKPPRYYLDMARDASLESRRVCAAHLVMACRTAPGPDSLPGGAWYARLLIEALETGGSDDLIALARQCSDTINRAAA